MDGVVNDPSSFLFTYIDTTNRYREMIHGQLLRMGERMFGDPAAGIQYSYLRADPSKPDCDKDANIDALVQKEMAAPATDDGLGGLFNDAKNPEQIKQSLLAAQSLCKEKYTFYENVNQHVTTPVRAYRISLKKHSFIFSTSVHNIAH